jgi:hypothetical protein
MRTLFLLIAFCIGTLANAETSENFQNQNQRTSQNKEYVKKGKKKGKKKKGKKGKKGDCKKCNTCQDWKRGDRMHKGQGMWNKGGMDRARHGRWGNMHKGNRMMMAHKMMKHQMKDLTEAEKKTMKKLQKEFMESNKTVRNNLQLKRAELRHESQKENPNETLINKKIDEIQALETQMKLNHFKHRKKVLAQIPTLKAKHEKMQQKMEKFKEKREGRKEFRAEIEPLRKELRELQKNIMAKAMDDKTSETEMKSELEKISVVKAKLEKLKIKNRLANKKEWKNRK